MISSGVMWSMEVKQAMLEYATSDAGRQFRLLRGGWFRSSITTKDALSTAKFTTNDFGKVFDENDNEIPRGSATPGFIAFGGLKLGYYKDEEKPPKLSKHWWCALFDPRRLLPRRRRRHIDLARTRLGVHQLAGEKIYPEEVEEALNRDSVEDALVVGVPDENGAAGPQLSNSLTGLNLRQRTATVREKLAGYKSPKHVLPAARLSVPPMARLITKV